MHAQLMTEDKLERPPYRIYRALIDCEGMITGHGHVCGAPRGETCPIPPELEREARRFMELVEGQEEVKPAKVISEKKVYMDREEAIVFALKSIAVRNDPSDFIAATGYPKAIKVSKEASVGIVRKDEVNKLWPKVKAEVVHGASAG